MQCQLHQVKHQKVLDISSKIASENRKKIQYPHHSFDSVFGNGIFPALLA
jgi:hypothetical protein